MLNSILILALAAVAPLVDAVKSGDRAAAITLIAQRVDVNAPEADGTTALHWAVRADDAESVAMLLGAGANANAANRYGIEGSPRLQHFAEIRYSPGNDALEP